MNTGDRWDCAHGKPSLLIPVLLRSVSSQWSYRIGRWSKTLLHRSKLLEQIRIPWKIWVAKYSQYMLITLNWILTHYLLYYIYLLYIIYYYYICILYLLYKLNIRGLFLKYWKADNNNNNNKRTNSNNLPADDLSNRK